MRLPSCALSHYVNPSVLNIRFFVSVSVGGHFCPHLLFNLQIVLVEPFVNLAAVIAEWIAPLDKINVHNPIFDVEGHRATKNEDCRITALVDSDEAYCIVCGIAEALGMGNVRVHFARSTVPRVDGSGWAVGGNC